MLQSYWLCLLIQLAAVAISLAVFRVGSQDAWTAAGIYLLVSSFIFAYWLKLLADMRIKEATAAEREKYLAERERLKVEAEQQKLSLLRDTHKQVSQQAARASARTNLKIAALASAAVLVGVALIATQMFTLGLLALSTAGGALGGYLMRLRQEQSSLQKRVARDWVRADEEELEDTMEVLPALPHSRRA